MKVGVITFHRAINYGAVLQAYALLQTLDKLGAETEILDYRCDYLEKNYSILQRLRNTKSIKSLAAVFLKCAIPAIKKKIAFNSWLNKNCNLSQSYKKDIESASDKYDVFITGSDQVWNYKHTKFDKTYFLDFVHDRTRKFSYAASFGFSELEEEYELPYKALLEDFSGISVREASGAKLAGELLGGTNIPVAIDPVFLLRAQEWDLKAKSKWEKMKFKDKYVLIYELMPSEDVVNFALQLAQKYDLRIIRITNTIHRPPHKRIKNVIGISPKCFLQYINNAEYVVTNSFHGTAFSILFNKQFFVSRLTGTMTKLNARLDDLLALCSLENRVAEIGTNYEEIDYARLNVKLEKERQAGILYLKETILKI